MLSELCYSCILGQAGKTMDLFGVKDEVQRQRIYKELDAGLKARRNELNGPLFTLIMQDILSRVTHIEDPYLKLKEKNLAEAIKYIPTLENLLKSEGDRLRTAVKIAITGNIIDMGISREFDLNAEIKNISTEIILDDYPDFLDSYNTARTVLYIGDNYEEAIFDIFLLREIQHKDVVFATRKGNILNDISYRDAIDLGIDKYCRVIESGSRIAGTDLKMVNEEFRELFETSDIVISKGQGNLETLMGAAREIYFLFKVKCRNISNISHQPMGRGVLFSNKHVGSND